MERNDEIGDLAKAFDDMVETLDARDEEVELLLETSVAVSSTKGRQGTPASLRKDIGIAKSNVLPHFSL